MFHFYNQNKSQYISREQEPQNIRITNLTPNSFTVTWFTATPSIGTLVFGQSQNLGSSQNDDRDPTPISRKTHSVTVNNLLPQTTYFFKLRNDTFFFPQKPITLTTPSIYPTTANRPITGTITTPDNTGQVDILVFLQSQDSTDLSTTVDQNLNYNIPLSNLRTRDQKSVVQLDPNHPLPANLLATDSTKNSFILLKIPNLTPIPTITLGQNMELNQSTATGSSSLLPLN